MKYILIIIVVALISCNKETTPKFTNLIDSAGIGKHIRVLASDEFEGRFPASKGEKKTIDYVTSVLKEYNIKPANGDSYLQSFDIVEIKSTPDEQIKINSKNKSINLKWKDDYVAQTRQIVDIVNLEDAELIFCGFGITAPEYNWNDFKETDMKGKIAVVFVNDPGFATQDKNLFNGNNMTYYGRWSYKYEEAARQNCAGLIIIHENDAAGYPWEVVKSGWSTPEMNLKSANNNMDRAKFEGWITKDKAIELFKSSGLDFDELKKMACKADFKPIPLNQTLSINIKVETKETKTNNIIGKIDGSSRKDETVIYMGHWDHYGIDPSITEGDNISNGARDNASGVAGILEIAENFAKNNQKPERTIVFLFSGAEEHGLLGSKHYSENPLFPLDKTALVINIDGLNIWGKMNDITQIGRGQSPDLDASMTKYAKAQNRVVIEDLEGEKGYFYRSDHFSLVKKGVPAIYTHTGFDIIGKSREEAEKTIKDWTEKFYHKPGDEWEDWWDLTGAVDDMILMYEIGNEVANSKNFPAWSEKSEFKGLRK